MKKFWTLFCLIFLTSGCAGRRTEPRISLAPKEKGASYYYLASEADLRRGDLTAALEKIDQAILIDPMQARLWYKRAFLNAASGNIEKAQEDIGKSLEFDPSDAEAWALSGKIYQSLNRLPEAIRQYSQALALKARLGHDTDDVSVLLIEANVVRKHYQSALNVAKDWERREPENVSPILYQASLLQNVFKDSVGAANAYERVLEIDPNHGTALTSLAQLALLRHEEQKALEILERMESLASQNKSEDLSQDIAVKLKIALIYYEQKQYDKAISKFRELAELHPDQDRVIYYLGVIYENLKRDAEAEAEFSKISISSNFYKDGRLHLAYLKVRAGRADEAIRILEEAIAQKPQVAALYEYLAEILKNKKRYEEMVALLKKGVQKSPEKDGLYYLLGETYDRLDRFDDMVKTMREAIKSNPKNANALNYLGYSLAERGGNLDEALELTKRALILKPNDGYVTDSVGWIYFKKGDVAAAEEYIRRALLQTPQDPAILEHMGDLLMKKGDRTQALRYYREAFVRLQQTPAAAETLLKDVERLGEKIKSLMKGSP